MIEAFKKFLNNLGVNIALHQEYVHTFETKTGEKVLEDLVTRFGVLDSYYTSGSTPTDLAYREGQRSVVLTILGILNVDPAIFVEKSKSIVRARTREQLRNVR